MRAPGLDGAAGIVIHGAGGQGVAELSNGAAGHLALAPAVIAAEHEQAAQAGQAHEGGQVADAVVGDVQVHQVRAVGQGRDVRNAGQGQDPASNCRTDICSQNDWQSILKRNDV